MATTLEDLLALLPDNQTGAISAADLREVTTGLWDYTAGVQRDLNDAIVEATLALQRDMPKVGQVASDGSMVGGPAGWTSSYDAGTGLYTVQHDLGTEAYAVVVTPLVKDEGGFAPAVEETTSTSFTYGVWSSKTGAVHGMYTNFVVGVL